MLLGSRSSLLERGFHIFESSNGDPVFRPNGVAMIKIGQAADCTDFSDVQPSCEKSDVFLLEAEIYLLLRLAGRMIKCIPNEALWLG